ncbi:MAG: diacylglycerol kinase family protein [Bacteroidota bacterium]
MSQSKRYGFIFNPAARHGTAQKFESRILTFLNKNNINYSFYKTNGVLDAVRIAREIYKICDVVVAIGGDGTINEVVSGLIEGGTDQNGENSSVATLGILPLGSGNDLNKVIGMSLQIEEALNALINGVKRTIDIGRIFFKRKENLQFETRMFINSLGIGIDAEIANEIKRIKYLNGLGLYLYAAIKVLLRYRAKEIRIQADSWNDSGKKYMICLGNGSYEGGGFRFFPDADPADGLLNMCVIPKIPLLKTLPIIPRIIRGTHITDPRITFKKIKQVEFQAVDLFSVHADGEFLGSDIVSMKIDVLEHRLNVLYPH